MLQIIGRGVLGEIKSKLRMIEDSVERVCEIPLDIQVEGAIVVAEIMAALHVGELFDALYSTDGKVRLTYFGQQSVDFPVKNIKAVIGLSSSSKDEVTIAAADLSKIRWTVVDGFGLHITAKVCAKLSPDQWVKLFRLQPYTGLSVSLTDNQSALSLQAA
jgi:hypothetical protein